MEKLEDGGKGVLVIGTVKGDVHDIGKNLVDIILTNNGYEVHNIGIKAPLQDFVDKAKEVNADAIGMSGLLVKSTLIMRENLQSLNELGLAETPVILGGAALTRTYVERDLREVYEGRLFYGKDAFEGLYTMDTLMDGKRTGTLAPEFGREAGGRDLPPRKSERDTGEAVDVPARSDVALDVPVFTPPFLGSRVAKGVSLDEILGYLNGPRCSATSGSSDPTRRRTRTTPRSRSGSATRWPRSSSKAKAGNWLVPAVVWGYFPVNAEGDELIVWTDETAAQERARFTFPRQQKDRFLSIPDFFRPVDSGEADYAGLHGRDHGQGRNGPRARALRRGPVPGVPPRSRPLDRDDRGAHGALAPADA